MANSRALSRLYTRATVVVTYKDGSQKMILQDFEKGDTEKINDFFIKTAAKYDSVIPNTVVTLSCSSTECYDHKSH